LPRFGEARQGMGSTGHSVDGRRAEPARRPSSLQPSAARRPRPRLDVFRRLEPARPAARMLSLRSDVTAEA
jgi:hypothetical protein